MRRNQTVKRTKDQVKKMMMENHEFELQLDGNTERMLRVQVNQINNLNELYDDFKEAAKMAPTVNIRKDYIIKSERNLIVGEIGDIDALRPS